MRHRRGSPRLLGRKQRRGGHTFACGTLRFCTCRLSGLCGLRSAAGSRVSVCVTHVSGVWPVCACAVSVDCTAAVCPYACLLRVQADVYNSCTSTVGEYSTEPTR